MTKKLDVLEVVEGYKSGMLPEDLAIKYQVHPTTIRRYLREGGITLKRTSHLHLLKEKEKNTLLQLLSNFNIPNVNLLINELDKNFILTLRNDPYKNFEPIQLRR